MQSGRIPAVFIWDLSGCLPHSSITPFEFCDIWRFWTLLHFVRRICHHLQENRFWAASDSIFDHVLEFFPHRFCFLGSFFWKMLPECSRMRSALDHAFSVQFYAQFRVFTSRRIAERPTKIVPNFAVFAFLTVEFSW